MDHPLSLHLQLGHALLQGLVGLDRHLPQLRNLAQALLGQGARALQLMLQRVGPARRCLPSLPAQPGAWYLTPSEELSAGNCSRAGVGIHCLPNAFAEHWLLSQGHGSDRLSAACGCCGRCRVGGSDLVMSG